MAWNYGKEDQHEDFGEKLAAGTYHAVVFAVYDMGIQKSVYAGVEKEKHFIRIGIELDKLYTTGKYAGSRITKYPKFTLSFYGEAKLGVAVRGILGRDMSKQEIEDGGVALIGKNFSLSVSYKKDKDGADSKFPDFIFAGLMEGIKPITPVLQPDYMPEFITKEIAEKAIRCTGEATPKGETVTPTYLEQIVEWGKNKIVSKQDFENTIFAVTKVRLSFSELSEEQQISVYKKLKEFVDLKSGMKPLNPDDFFQ
jgi:hypothetical protein